MEDRSAPSISNLYPTYLLLYSYPTIFHRLKHKRQKKRTTPLDFIHCLLVPRLLSYSFLRETLTLGSEKNDYTQLLVFDLVLYYYIVNKDKPKLYVNFYVLTKTLFTRLLTDKKFGHHLRVKFSFLTPRRLCLRSSK